LNGRETEILDRYHDTLEKMGFETDHFGGMEISVRTAPADLYGVSIRDMFLEMLDDLEETGSGKFNGIEERIATMACKAAVKGNHKMSLPEINSLFDQLLTLENPYFCPHGRPTMISFSQYEIDRKFKRIV
jgi:DNA mismatch repair protein MutL